MYFKKIFKKDSWYLYHFTQEPVFFDQRFLLGPDQIDLGHFSGLYEVTSPDPDLVI